jgi:uncharacterized protein
MTYKFDGFNWLVRLRKGDLLMRSLAEIAQKENVAGAWVMGLGAAAWAEVGYYDLEKQEYRWKKLDKTLEITSLQGNIGWDGDEPAIHIHGTFSDENMQAFGGHVKELEAAGTVELLLHRWYDSKIRRKLDGETGLKLLDI